MLGRPLEISLMLRPFKSDRDEILCYGGLEIVGAITVITIVIDTINCNFGEGVYMACLSNRT